MFPEEQLRSIKSTTIVKEILDQIKEMLLNKELRPGHRLPSEKDMAEQFGVGKSSIREAMKMLDAVGIVESRQGLGTMICEKPKDDAINPLIFQMLLMDGSEKNLLDFRRMFETSYTFMAMDTMTDEDKNEITKNLIPISSAREDGNFHRAILYSTHNPYVIRVGEVLIDLCEIALTRERRATHMETGMNREHQMIFDALQRKDRCRLQEALDESFELFGNYFIRNNNGSK